MYAFSDDWNFNLPGAILLTVAGAQLVLGWRARAMPSFPGQGRFVRTQWASAWWAIAAAVENMAWSPADKLFWAEMAWPGIIASSFWWALFVWAYCKGEDRRTGAALQWVAIMLPLGVWGLALTNDHHGLIYLSASPIDGRLGAPLLYIHGAGFYPIVVCTYVAMLFSLVVVIHAAQQAPRLYRRQYLELVLGMLLPWLFSIGYVTDTVKPFGFDGTPFALLLTSAIFYRQIGRKASFVLPPIVHRTLLDALPDAVMVLDGNGTVVEGNAAAAELAGTQALVGRRLGDLPLGDLGSQLGSIDGPALRELALPLDGDRHFVVRAQPLLYRGRDVGRVVVLTDITGRKLAERRLRRQLEANLALQRKLREQAVHDLLTGLYNRHFLEEVRDDLLATARGAGKPLTAVMLDLDHFKALNDSWGHAAGDDVLRAVADFLRRHARQDDILVRVGGEEILVLMPGSPARQTERRVDLWRQEFAGTPIRSQGQALQVTFSAGLAAFPADAESWDALMGRADAALYRAKNSGRNQVCRWEAEGCVGEGAMMEAAIGAAVTTQGPDRPVR